MSNGAKANSSSAIYDYLGGDINFSKCLNADVMPVRANKASSEPYIDTKNVRAKVSAPRYIDVEVKVSLDTDFITG